MSHSHRILSTARLSANLLNQAAASGVIIDEVPFIQVIDITDQPGILNRIVELYKKNITAIFTSTNAIYAICEQPFFKAQDWNIFCTGPATEKVALEYFKEQNIKGVAENATALADLVVQFAPADGVVFFCGDQRLDALPGKLKNADIAVEEIIVYETMETPIFVENEYDGILFLSPTAVNSYFNLNIPAPETIMFAIGNTTAKAVKDNTDNTIVVSSVPSKTALVNEVIMYFANEKKTGV